VHDAFRGILKRVAWASVAPKVIDRRGLDATLALARSPILAHGQTPQEAPEARGTYAAAFAHATLRPSDGVGFFHAFALAGKLPVAPFIET